MTIICTCGKHGRKNGKTPAGTQRYRCADGHSWVLDGLPAGRPEGDTPAKTSTERSRDRRAKKKLKDTLDCNANSV